VQDDEDDGDEDSDQVRKDLEELGLINLKGVG